MAPRTLTEVRKYFENSTKEGWSVCQICQRKLKNDRTNNLKQHLVKIHQLEMGTKRETGSPLSNAPPAKRMKTKIKMHIDKIQLFRSYIGLVTEDNVSFDVLNSPNMQNLIDPICQTLREKGHNVELSSDGCKRTLSVIVETIRSTVKKELQHKLLSLKIDVSPTTTTIPNDGISIVSVQFVQDDLIQNNILGLVDASNSKNLTSDILNILHKYDINLQQIISITTTHDICNFFDKSFGENFEDIQICCCAADLSQRCAKDVANNEEIEQYLRQCRNLTNFIRQSSSAGLKVALDLKNLHMTQLDRPTYIMMISELYAAKDVLQTIGCIQNKSDDENFQINDELWEFMDAYITVFRPLQKAMLQFQEEQLHYGDVYAQWLKCKLYTEHIIQNISEKGNSIKYKICCIILASIEESICKLTTNECFNACLFLDPRFQHTLTPVNRTKAVNYLKKLWDKLTALKTMDKILPNQNPAALLKHEYEHKEEQLLDQFLCEGIQPSVIEITAVYSKIVSLQLPFMRSDTNVLSFWKDKKYLEPELYALSHICFSIPPTQTSRNNTLLSEVIENNNNLDKETLENLLLVKVYPSFLNKAINTLPLFENPNEVGHNEQLVTFEDGANSTWTDEYEEINITLHSNASDEDDKTMIFDIENPVIAKQYFSNLTMTTTQTPETSNSCLGESDAATNNIIPVIKQELLIDYNESQDGSINN